MSNDYVECFIDFFIRGVVQYHCLCKCQRKSSVAYIREEGIWDGLDGLVTFGVTTSCLYSGVLSRFQLFKYVVSPVCGVGKYRSFTQHVERAAYL